MMVRCLALLCRCFSSVHRQTPGQRRGNLKQDEATTPSLKSTLVPSVLLVILIQSKKKENKIINIVVPLKKKKENNNVIIIIIPIIIIIIIVNINSSKFGLTAQAQDKSRQPKIFLETHYIFTQMAFAYFFVGCPR